MNPLKTSTLLLEQLTIRDFRNLQRIDLEPAARINVVSGSNGHGKTSLLEAIYFAATSRSFRTHRVADLVRHMCSIASVKARFTEHTDALTPISREQSAAVERKACTVKVDGNRPQSLASFATRSPVVVFHPEELALSTGPARLRRKLLDRIALFIDPASAEHRTRYALAIKTRQELLHRRGASSRKPHENSAELDAFEELCALHGAKLTQARQQAARVLIDELYTAFAQIADPELHLDARFEAGGSVDVEESRRELCRQRGRDSHRTSAGFGPHRDELQLLFNEHPARLIGSQGQHRALTLSIKAAEVATVAHVRGLEPILLLDDVSSELDSERTAALFKFLTMARGQIFLTTTRRDLIVTPELRELSVNLGLMTLDDHGDIDRNCRRDFRIERGILEPLS